MSETFEQDWQDETHAETVRELEAEQVGWPGDGSGEDDFADYNANEADDYANEGADDCHDTPIGDDYGGE